MGFSFLLLICVRSYAEILEPENQDGKICQLVVFHITIEKNKKSNGFNK